jgi:hypothetical protein
LVYIDDYGKGVKDTIRILIPNPKQAVDEVKQEPKQDKKIPVIIADTTSKAVKNVTPETNEPATNKATKKENCLAIATENDFLKVRKNMAAVTGDDDMVDAAKKYFKTKCFTTVQVKNLSALFLNDAGKYKFFDAAYNHVLDMENFGSLQSELKDDYYINRFKAMLRN